MVCRLSRVLNARRKGLALIPAPLALAMLALPALSASATTPPTAETLRHTGTAKDAHGRCPRFAFWGRGSRRLVRHRRGAVRASRIAACAVASAAAVALSAAGPALASGWSIQSTPNPAGATRSYLTGVSCTAATATVCTAAGYSLGSPPYAPLAEGWTSSTNTWSIQTTPNQGLGVVLSGVSCTLAPSCTAVGQHLISIPWPGHKPPFRLEWLTAAEQWNGTAWSIQTPANSSYSFNALYGVSCTAATACTAVGQTSSVTLAERWNGSTWLLQTTSGAGAGVSCPTATACTAVGQGNNAPLAERWDSTTNTWSIQTTPITAVGASLSAVSCTAPTSCTAVGQSANQTLVERWNGNIWAIQPTPNPAGSTSSVLSSVSCKGTSCIAVGNYVNASNVQLTLAEHWNASTNTWSIQTTPNPSGATSSLLSGVSCTTATACTAVGDYANASGTGVTLAESYTTG
jgi:hypothetical protein